MQRTILYFLAITACTFAASIQGGNSRVALNAQAQEIVDAAEPLMDAKKIAKMVRIVASSGPNARAFVASLSNITPAARTCVMTQGKSIGEKVKTQQIKPEDAGQAILDACAPYKAELEPTITAYKGAIPEWTASSGTFYNDLPQSFNTFFQHYTALSQEIQANRNLPKDPATFGPKVKALIDEFKAIPEADRAALGDKLQYTKEFLLPSGQYYADFNQILDYIVAKASGQQYDETDLKAKAKTLEQYVISHSEEELKYLNDKIDAFVVPDEVAQDGAVNKVAAAAGKTGSSYAKMAFSQPQFNQIMNGLVEGKMNAAVPQNMAMVA